MNYPDLRTPAKRPRYNCRYDEVLTAFALFLWLRGRNPTEKELMAILRMHRSALRRTLSILTERGLLIHEPIGTLRYRFSGA